MEELQMQEDESHCFSLYISFQYY
uniref:Uncharacterized protein n=1 Tax=Lepeophtheirus salmonis TaxID=72036 RepID=A0A0K2ULD0_LEPSM